MRPSEIIERSLTFSYEWILPLAEDLADAPFTDPTGSQGNHPTWILGHMTFSKAGLLAMISGQESPVADWKERFSGGTQPRYEASFYPAYDTILQAYRDTHQQALSLLQQLGDERLDAKPLFVWEAIADDPDFQTNARLFLFIAMHEMSHRGQLADARKVLSRKPFA